MHVHADTARSIQPKLTIGVVADTYEQEADRVAQYVVSRGNAVVPARPSLALYG